MAKKLKRVWLVVDEETHGKVIDFAGSQRRSIQGQYLHFVDLGMMTWAQKIEAELNQQQALVRERFTNQKRLLRATPSKEEQREKESA